MKLYPSTYVINMFNKFSTWTVVTERSGEGRGERGGEGLKEETCFSGHLCVYHSTMARNIERRTCMRTLSPTHIDCSNNITVCKLTIQILTFKVLRCMWHVTSLCTHTTDTFNTFSQMLPEILTYFQFVFYFFHTMWFTCMETRFVYN